MLMVGNGTVLPRESAMLKVFLAAWVAFAGKGGEKLPEKWGSCYRALQYSCWHVYYPSSGPYGGGRIGGTVFVSPTLQWAVPNSCLNGPPVRPSDAHPDK